MAIRVPVALGRRSYDVVIGRGLARDAAAFIQSLEATTTVAITDSNADQHYRALIESVAQRAIVVAPGEPSKSLAVFESVLNELLAPKDLDRQSVIVAMGGGVVGDLAGFAAATLFRGVRWVQIPTSLLAMVDSSVGGKTGINFAGGKNQIGAFHQPAGVFCDLEVLATLPEREYVSALAEIVKTAALSGTAMLEALEQSAAALLARELQALEPVIESCVRFKAAVVADDELERSDRRATLNFGHTIAHALEALLPGRWLHGEAVAIGLAAALRISVNRTGLGKREADRMLQLLERFGLPVRVPADVEADAVAELILSDKKRVADRVRIVALNDIGAPTLLDCRLDDALLRTLLGREHE